MSKAEALGDAKTAARPSAIASLPMYDLPQLQQATDTFWKAIADRLTSAGLTAVPTSLSRSEDYRADWRDPHLLLGQTCGYPFVTQLKSAVQIVATPIYSSPGCEGFEHSSVFIVNAKAQHRMLRDLRGHICAVNSFDSNSGMNVLRAAIAPMTEGSNFFRSVTMTGSHHKSLEAVAEGSADIAAIDCVSFAHFERFEPDLTRHIKKIGESARTAAPPFITSRHTDAGTLRILKDVLNSVAAEPKLESLRSALAIDGFAFETEAAYDRLLLIEKDAAALGYPELR